MAKTQFKKEVEVHVNYDGKTPPYSETLEETVLGQLMLQGDALSEVMNLPTKKEIFYIPKNQIIFEAKTELAKENEPITLVTVIEKLKSVEQLDSVGGPSYLIDLSMRVSTSANIENHVKLLVQKYIQRELIRVSAVISEKAFDPSCQLAELTDTAEKEILSVTDQSLQKKSSWRKRIYGRSVGIPRARPSHHGMASWQYDCIGGPSGYG